MLEQKISKAHSILKDAQQKLSVESAAAVEQVYNDIVVLKDFIDKELSTVESSSNLDESSKKSARRSVFEQAARKLEVIKSKRNYSNISEALEERLAVTSVEEDVSLLQFFRQKEVRDRLSDMTEAQIIGLFGKSLFAGTNPLLSSAILNAPLGFEPVSKEVILKLRQASAKRLSPEITEELEMVRNLNSMVGDMFGFVKNELNNLRNKELPTALTQLKDPKARPFKF